MKMLKIKKKVKENYMSVLTVVIAAIVIQHMYFVYEATEPLSTVPYERDKWDKKLTYPIKVQGITYNKTYLRVIRRRSMFQGTQLIAPDSTKVIYEFFGKESPFGIFYTINDIVDDRGYALYYSPTIGYPPLIRGGAENYRFYLNENDFRPQDETVRPDEGPLYLLSYDSDIKNRKVAGNVELFNTPQSKYWDFEWAWGEELNLMDSKSYFVANVYFDKAEHQLSIIIEKREDYTYTKLGEKIIDLENPLDTKMRNEARDIFINTGVHRNKEFDKRWFDQLNHHTMKEEAQKMTEMQGEYLGEIVVYGNKVSLYGYLGEKEVCFIMYDEEGYVKYKEYIDLDYYYTLR